MNLSRTFDEMRAPELHVDSGEDSHKKHSIRWQHTLDAHGTALDVMSGAAYWARDVRDVFQYGRYAEALSIYHRADVVFTSHSCRQM